MQTILDAHTAKLAAAVDASLRCEHPSSADHGAELAAVCREGCGTTLLMCEQHMEALRGQIAEHAPSGALVGCVVCRTSASSLDAVFDVIEVRPGQ